MSRAHTHLHDTALSVLQPHRLQQQLQRLRRPPRAHRRARSLQQCVHGRDDRRLRSRCADGGHCRCADPLPTAHAQATGATLSQHTRGLGGGRRERSQCTHAASCVWAAHPHVRTGAGQHAGTYLTELANGCEARAATGTASDNAAPPPAPARRANHPSRCAGAQSRRTAAAAAAWRAGHVGRRRHQCRWRQRWRRRAMLWRALHVLWGGVPRNASSGRNVAAYVRCMRPSVVPEPAPCRRGRCAVR